MELNRQVNAGLADPKFMARFAEVGARVRPGSPEDYAKFIADETEKWGAIVKSTGSQLE
jgi:tripartite-type tricarboxylate transporter receptor subunit TctC